MFRISGPVGLGLSWRIGEFGAAGRGHSQSLEHQWVDEKPSPLGQFNWRSVINL